MIVVHYVRVSALYPRVVISSLRGRLENQLFATLYTSFDVWPRDHYMSLQRFTISRMPSFAKVVCSTVALLRFPGVDVVPRPLLHRVSLGAEEHQILTHPSKAHFP
jgi:hypothetical protein